MARPTVVPLAIHAISAFVPIRHVLPSLARLNMSPSLKPNRIATWFAVVWIGSVRTNAIDRSFTYDAVQR